MFFSLQIWYVDMHAVMATRFVNHSTMKEKLQAHGAMITNYSQLEIFKILIQGYTVVRY